MSSRYWIFLIGTAAALLGFAVGAAWQYASVRNASSELAETSRALAQKRVEATLAAATIAAQQARYEPARQLASAFFTELQVEVGRVPPAAAGSADAAFRQLLAERDLTITALSRADPGSGAMLAQIYGRYRAAVGEPIPVGAAEPPAEQPAAGQTPGARPPARPVPDGR